MQRVETDRLGQVIVHAGAKAALAVAGHGIRGHCDDVHVTHYAVLGLRQLGIANATRGFEAVHSGHLAVHQDHVVRDVLQRVESLLAVHDDVGAISELAELCQSDPLIHEIVLGQQQPRPVRWRR